MRIAHVVPYRVSPYSGVLSAIGSLTSCLAARGLEVELWELSEWPEEAWELAERAERGGIRRVRIPSSRPPWHLGGAGRQAIRRRPIDLVHLHNVFSPLNNAVARSLRCPYVLSPHGGYSPAVLRRNPLRKRLLRLFLENRLAGGAARLVALTEAEKEDLRSFGYRGPIEVIPNGVDRAPTQAAGDRFRRELGVPEARRLAVYLGRLDLYYKRLAESLRGVAAAPGWHLALIGPDWRGGKAKLERMIQGLGIENRVRVLEPRRGERLREALAAADTLVLLSRGEGLSLSLLEALSQGTPVVVSPEVQRTLDVSAAGAGWTTEPGVLGERLRHLGDMDAMEWARAREAARGLAARFSWQKSAEALERAYERVVAGVPGA